MKASALGLFLVLTGALLVSSSSEAGGAVRVGDSKLSVVLSNDDSGLLEESYEVSAKRMAGLTGKPWTAETNNGAIAPKGARLLEGRDGTTLNKRVSFSGSLGDVDWQLDYEVTGPGRITKTLTLTPRTSTTIRQVSLWSGSGDTEPVIPSTSLQDIAAFYRQDDRGMFVSLDFPYSKVLKNGSETAVTYPPHVTLEAGKPYVCHTLTIGATELTGRMRHGYYEGEVDAMDSYVQERFPLRFDRPMFTSASIYNRYTMVQGDIVFYTMKDHPSFGFNIDLLKREIELLPKIGMEYYQIFPGPFDSVPDDPDPKVIRNIVEFAKQHGVHVGDYSDINSCFCMHYNEYRNSIASYPESHLSAGDVCLGNPRFVKFYKSIVVDHDKRYGFDLHILDFLNIGECNSPNHGHAVGRDSIYAQVRGLADILEGLNAVSPDMMTWSNAGNWGQFLPKIAWTHPNLYLADPYINQPWQGLNMTRLLDDARREQMVALHNSLFIPYRFLTNCQYFFCQNSIVPDIRNYEFGALSTVAVTPNLCLAEVRPWIGDLTAERQEQVIGFYKKWTDFLKRNYSLWTKTYQVGDDPGMGSVEIYGHADGDHGFVFLVNPNYWDRTVDVPLDRSLGFSGRGKCEVSELYPVERLRLTANGPFASLGSKIPIRVPAQTVVVLEVRPAPKTVEKPRLYGVPGSIEATISGYLMKTWGPQGRTERCAVLLPTGAKPIASAEVRDVPKQPKRLWSPTLVKFVAGTSDGVAMDITFRRDAAPDELRRWRVRNGSLADGEAAGWANGFEGGTDLEFPLFSDVSDGTVELPMWDATADKLGLGPLSNFCGAYIDNAFSETQQTWIDLRTTDKTDLPDGALAAGTRPTLRPLSEMAKDKNGNWWVQTSFHLPFMYTLGAEPCSDEHTIMVLPFVRQPRIGQVKAWINGVPVEVRKYAYPRNRSQSCFYADLVGSGAHGAGVNNLVIWFEAK